MKPKTFIKKEKKIWHNHFIPSIIAGIAMGIIAIILDATLDDIILFASVGASAFILSNSKSHHLTKLRTAIVSYLIAIIAALLIFSINLFFSLHIALNIFLLVFLVGIFLYLFDAVHPPAISASIAFILFQRPLIDLAYLFLTIIILFILIRIVAYSLSQHLSIKEFLNEFKKHM